MFLQETHSTVYDEKRWQNELKEKISFSNDIETLAEWLCLLENMNFNVLNKIQDNNGRILILDAQVDDAAFLLINLYNANEE